MHRSIFLTGLLFGTAILTGCALQEEPTSSIDQAPSQSSPTTTAAPEPSFSEHARNLSIIDTGGPDSAATYQTLLTELSTKYAEGEQQIADMSAGAASGIKKQSGLKVTTLEIMQGMRDLYPNGEASQPFKDCAVAYALMRAKGEPHEASVKSLKAMYARLEELR